MYVCVCVYVCMYVCNILVIPIHFSVSICKYFSNELSTYSFSGTC